MLTPKSIKKTDMLNGNKSRLLVAAIVLIGLSATILGCSSAANTVEEAYSPTFDFTPPSSERNEEIRTTVALLETRQEKDDRQITTQKSVEHWTQAEPFSSFSDRLDQGFEEILTRRGLTVKEKKYESIDKMTFPYKESTDLVLKPQLEVEISTTSFEEKSEGLGRSLLLAMMGREASVIQGDEMISGRITLVLVEPLSGERMWERSIDIEDTKMRWKSARTYGGRVLQLMRRNPGSAGVIAASYKGGDLGYKNPMSKNLEEYYSKILDTAWDYLNPRELSRLKKKADELKERYRTGD